MFEFFEDSFDLEKSNEYILSIQVSLDGFSFSIVRPSDQKLLCFKNSEIKISSNSLIARRFKEWINSENLLQKTFLKTRIVVFNDIFTLIPEHLHDNSYKQQLTNIMFENSEKMNILETRIEKIDAKLLFHISKDLEKTFREIYSECDILHPVKLIVEHFPKDPIGKSLFLYFNDKNLYFVLFENGNLLMANNFSINHTNDVIYYVLTVLKQLGFATKDTHLLYAGKSPYSNEIETNLGVYLHSVKEALPNINEDSSLPKKLFNEYLIQLLPS